MRLLVVTGSPPEISRSFVPKRRMAAQPPGPGIGLAAAIGPDFDWAMSEAVGMFVRGSGGSEAGGDIPAGPCA